MVKVTEAKQAAFARLVKNLEEHNSIVFFGADFVGSAHMQRLRRTVREAGATMVMGKNSQMKRAFAAVAEEKPHLDAAAKHLVRNVGVIFTNGNPAEIIKILDENVEAAPAKVGRLATCDVTIKAGPTPLEVTQIQFLQKLGIPSKPFKMNLEITADVDLLKQGDIVREADVALLKMLDIQPFAYGLDAKVVFDGANEIDAAFFRDSEKLVADACRSCIANIAALSMECSIPTMAGMPHMVMGAFKNLQAVAAETEITFEEVKELKAYLADPSAFAVAAPAAAAATEEAAVEEPEEEEESEEGSFGFDGLF